MKRKKKSLEEADRKALIDTTVNIVAREASAITDLLTWNVKKDVYEALAAFFEGSIEECNRFIKRGDGEVVYVSPLVLQKERNEGASWIEPEHNLQTEEGKEERPPVPQIAKRAYNEFLLSGMPAKGVQVKYKGKQRDFTWVLDQLRCCDDTVPRHCCDVAELPQDCTYAEAVAFLE